MRVFSGVLVCVVVLGLTSAAGAGHHEDLTKEVEAIGNTLADAMVAGDTDTLLALYADDAISLPNYGPRMEGIAAFRQHHEQMNASGMKITSFTSEPTDVWGCGDQVIEIGNFTIALDYPGMAGIQDRGKYMTVYVRGADGSLKIKAETWNTDVSPMEQMGGEHGHGQ